MPAESAAGIHEPGAGHESQATGSFAVVALANALLDMSITVKDDYLVSKIQRKPIAPFARYMFASRFTWQQIHKYGLPCDGQVEVTSQQHGLFDEVQQKYSRYGGSSPIANATRAPINNERRAFD